MTSKIGRGVVQMQTLGVVMLNADIRIERIRSYMSISHIVIYYSLSLTQDCQLQSVAYNIYCVGYN